MQDSADAGIVGSCLLFTHLAISSSYFASLSLFNRYLGTKVGMLVRQHAGRTVLSIR